MKTLNDFLLNLALAIPVLGLLTLFGYFCVLRPLGLLLVWWSEMRFERQRAADRRWCVEHRAFLAPPRGNWSNAFAELDPEMVTYVDDSGRAIGKNHAPRTLFADIDTPGGVGE